MTPFQLIGSSDLGVPVRGRVLLFLCVQERFEQDLVFPYAVYRNGEMLGPSAPLDCAAVRSRRRGALYVAQEAALLFVQRAELGFRIRVCVTPRVLSVVRLPRLACAPAIDDAWVGGVAAWLERTGGAR